MCRSLYLWMEGGGSSANLRDLLSFQKNWTQSETHWRFKSHHPKHCLRRWCTHTCSRLDNGGSESIPDLSVMVEGVWKPLQWQKLLERRSHGQPDNGGLELYQAWCWQSVVSGSHGGYSNGVCSGSSCIGPASEVGEAERENNGLRGIERKRNCD